MKYLLAITMAILASHAVLQVGNKFPNSTLTNLIDGSSINIETYVSNQKENTTIIFWNIACGFCVEEITKLNKSNKSIITIVYAEHIKSVKKFLKDHNIKLIVLEGTSEIFQKYSVFAVPYTFIVDKKMKIIKMY